jgi:hypothetical protein
MNRETRAEVDRSIKEFLDNGKKIVNLSEGSVSEGTLRKQDLIPTLLDLLEVIHPIAHRYLIADNPIPEDAIDNDEHSFWESEEAQDLLDEVTEVLDTTPEKPDNLFFGSHPDDPASLGFWNVALLESLT